MLFDHNGTELDTAWMTSFATEQSCLPFVHVATDGTCFLETRRDRWEESHIRSIPRFEALRIASLYNLSDLKQFLIHQKQTRPNRRRRAAITVSPSHYQPTRTPSFNLNAGDRQTIELLHTLTPEQLDRLSQSLATAQ